MFALYPKGYSLCSIKAPMVDKKKPCNKYAEYDRLDNIVNIFLLKKLNKDEHNMYQLCCQE